MIGELSIIIRLRNGSGRRVLLAAGRTARSCSNGRNGWPMLKENG